MTTLALIIYEKGRFGQATSSTTGYFSSKNRRYSSPTAPRYLAKTGGVCGHSDPMNRATQENLLIPNSCGRTTEFFVSLGRDGALRRPDAAARRPYL
jgi:hypothetical protein